MAYKLNSMKRLLLLILLVFACSTRAEDESELTSAQRTEQIIQQCKSSRWKEYEESRDFHKDYLLADITKEEIECKEKAFLKLLPEILPEKSDQEEVAQLYQDYKANFLKLHATIARRNVMCGGEDLGCGTMRKIADTMAYDNAINDLITYTFESVR